MILFLLTLLTAALLIGYDRIANRGGWTNITLPSLSLAPLPVAALGLQFIALQWAEGPYRITLLGLSQVLLLAFFAANWKHKPLRLLAAGFFLNLLAMLTNGGYMPLTPEAMAGLHQGTSAGQWVSGMVRAGSKDIILNATESPLWFLGDVFVLAKPFPLPTAFSVGDVFILVGFTWTVYQLPTRNGVPDESN